MLEQIKKLLPSGETFSRMYKALEGDIRVISTDCNGCEYRYRVKFLDDKNIKLQRF